MSLISTIAIRDREVLAEDFNRLSGFTFQEYDISRKQFYTQSSESAAEHWNNSDISFLPSDLMRIFSQKELNGFKLSMKKDNFGLTSFTAKAPDIGMQEHTYNLKRKSIIDSQILLEGKQQGKKIGQALSMRFMDLDVVLGVKSVEFSAQGSVGGYLWALQGYELDNESSYLITRHEILSKKLFAKLSALKGFIPSDTLSVAKRHAELKKPDDLYHLAHMDFDLSKVLDSACLDMFFAVLQNEFEDADDIVGSFTQARANIESLQSFCRKNNKNLTLGKYLLMGERWYGKADYNNNRMMQRVEKHTGGFRYSKIIPKSSNHNTKNQTALVV